MDPLKDLSLPYLNEIATSILVREGELNGEYTFWKNFLKDSTVLIAEFESRVDEAEKINVTTIPWLNMVPGCCSSKASLKVQYTTALTWANDCISGICNHFKKTLPNLKVLEPLVSAVIATRQQAIDDYDAVEVAKQKVKDAQDQIQEHQTRISEGKKEIRAIHKKVEDTCITSQEKRTLRRLDKETKQASEELEKLRLETKKLEEQVKQKERDKNYRLHVVSLWRQIYSTIEHEIRKLEDPDNK